MNKVESSWSFEPGAEISPGRTARDYVGGGELCEVWRAWDEELQTTIICKLLRPDLRTDASAQRALMREWTLVSRFAHPMIVRSLGEAPRGDRPHIVLEDLEAPNLRRRLRRRGALTPEETAILGRHLGAALHYLERRDVVHLDVKPANVVRAGPVRLIDFSMARSRERARALRQPIGTARYMAPEVCNPGAGGEIGPASDVWGLGATLHEALTGKPPFAAGDATQEASVERRFPQLAIDAPPLPTDLPAALTNIVMACLARDPMARPVPLQLVSELGALADSGAGT